MATATTTEQRAECGAVLRSAPSGLRVALGLKRPKFCKLSGLTDFQVRYLEGVGGGSRKYTSSGDAMTLYSIGLLAIAVDRCMDLDAAWEKYNPSALFGLPPHNKEQMYVRARALLKPHHEGKP